MEFMNGLLGNKKPINNESGANFDKEKREKFDIAFNNAKLKFKNDCNILSRLGDSYKAQIDNAPFDDRIDLIENAAKCYKTAVEMGNSKAIDKLERLVEITYLAVARGAVNEVDGKGKIAEIVSFFHAQKDEFNAVSNAKAKLGEFFLDHAPDLSFEEYEINTAKDLHKGIAWNSVSVRAPQKVTDVYPKMLDLLYNDKWYGEVFKEPNNYESQGDRELWGRLQAHFSYYENAPSSVDDFKEQLGGAIFEIRGQFIANLSMFVDPLMGQPAGTISSDYWHNVGIPLIVARFAARL